MRTKRSSRGGEPVSASTASVVSGAIQDRNDGRFGIAFAVGAAGYVFSVIWISLVVPRLPILPDKSPPAVADPADNPDAAEAPVKIA